MTELDRARAGGDLYAVRWIESMIAIERGWLNLAVGYRLISSLDQLHEWRLASSSTLGLPKD